MNHSSHLAFAFIKMAAQEQSPGIGHYVGEGAAAVGVHKGLEYGANYLTRRNPTTSKYFQPFYSNMSRMGMQAGMTGGPTLFPRFRRVLGGLMPSVTGLADYEVGLQSGKMMANPMPNHPAGSLLGQGVTDIKNISQPMLAQLPNVNELNSPIAKHMVSGLKGPAPSPAANWLANKFSGPEHQMFSGSGKVVGDFLAGTAMHGPVGGLFTAAAGLPDAAALGAVSQGKINTITALKSRLMEAGRQGTMPAVAEHAMRAVDPPTAEFFDLGRDFNQMPSWLTAKTPIANGAAVAGRNMLGRTLTRHAGEPIMHALAKDFPSLLARFAHV